MANREQRGNREKRKPKAAKPDTPVRTSPFARDPQNDNKGKVTKKTR